MSANIHTDKTTGEAAVAYTGATPWHRCGQVITDPYDLLAGLKQAHADFEVETVPMFHDIGDETTPDGCFDRIPNRVVIRRTDTQVPLGVATDRYQPMQTRDGMDFLNEVLGKGKVRLEVAGVLGQGERVWVLVRLEGGQLPIIGDDVIEKFLLFALGHDGQFNFISVFTPVRVVCQNTLTAAMNKAKVDEVIKIRHTGDVQAKLKMAANLLRNAGVFFTEVAESYRYLASKQVDTKVLLSYMMEVCDQNVPFESTSQKVKNRIELYQRAHETGLGSDIKGVRGTLWGAYNAVTEVVDHQLSLNKADPVKYMGFGTGRDIKRKALTTALAYADQMN